MGIVLVGSYPLSADCIRGGVESSVYGLAQALVAKKHEVDVFDYPRLYGKDTSERNGLLTIHRYANNGKYNQDATERAKEMFRDIVALHPNVVHLHGTGELSLLLYRAINNYGIPVILTVHGLLHEEKKNALRKHPSLKHLYQYIHQSKIEFDLLSLASHIIVDTKYVANKINEYYAKGKISHLPTIDIIPQGINEHFITLYDKDKKLTKEILSVGSISKRKGHLYLVEAFEKVCQQIPDAKLVIAGVKSEPAYYEQLAKRITASNYKKNICLLTDLPQEELYQYYKEATLFALHSEEESQGIALVEAMAAGLPVVSTTVGGIPDVVTDEKTGLLSAYSNTDAFAGNILRLLHSPDLIAAMSIAAHNEAQDYIWDNIAAKIEKVYSTHIFM